MGGDVHVEHLAPIVLDDEQVSGAILDDGGNVLASFEGRVSATGMSGTYRDRTGEEGDWSWDRPFPD